MDRLFKLQIDTARRREGNTETTGLGEDQIFGKSPGLDGTNSSRVIVFLMGRQANADVSILETEFFACGLPKTSLEVASGIRLFRNPPEDRQQKWSAEQTPKTTMENPHGPDSFPYFQIGFLFEIIGGQST